MGVKKEKGMMMYSRYGGHGTGSECLGRALDLVQARLVFLRFARRATLPVLGRSSILCDFSIFVSLPPFSSYRSKR